MIFLVNEYNRTVTKPSIINYLIRLAFCLFFINVLFCFPPPTAKLTVSICTNIFRSYSCFSDEVRIRADDVNAIFNSNEPNLLTGLPIDTRFILVRLDGIRCKKCHRYYYKTRVGTSA